MTQADEVRRLREALRQIIACPDGRSKTWPQIDEIIRAALAIEPAPEVAPGHCDGCRHGLCGGIKAAPSPDERSAADALADAAENNNCNGNCVGNGRSIGLRSAIRAYRAARGSKP